jgi:hypothetical protein
MSVIVKSKEYERVERKGLDIKILRKKSNANSYAGWLIGRIKICRDDNNLELALIYEDAYKNYMAFQKIEKIKINSWRGKGGIKIWETPDNVIVEFAGKRGKEDKPNIKKVEYSKDDINKMIISINKLKDDFDNKIPSRFLGEQFYGRSWDSGVFSQRTDHTKFTHLLNILDYYGIIEYNRKGYTKVIKEVKDVKEIFPKPSRGEFP